MASPAARELLANLLKRREELRRESEALENLIATYAEISGAAAHEIERDDEQPDLYRGMSQRGIRTAQIADMMAATRRIILAEGHPMKRGELVRRLTEQGFKIDGNDKNKVFGTNLWRSGKFRPVGNRGYWPLDIDIPSESRSGQD